MTISVDNGRQGRVQQHDRTLTLKIDETDIKKSQWRARNGFRANAIATTRYYEYNLNVLNRYNFNMYGVLMIANYQ